jgi:hypothetical protein
MACNAGCAYDWYSICCKRDFRICSIYCTCLYGSVPCGYYWVFSYVYTRLLYKYRGFFSYCSIWVNNWNCLYIQS